MSVEVGEAPKVPAGRGGYIKPLRGMLPYGMLTTRKCLMARGLSGHALDNAVKTETLLPLAPGVYAQYTREIRWEGVATSLQRMGGTSVPSVHVGGLTALLLMGMAHHLPMRALTVHLYTHDRLPGWLFRLPLPENFKRHSVKALWPESLMADKAYLKEYQWDVNLPPLYISCPEKALMEVLHWVPINISLDHADNLMVGQVNLSPRKLDGLLSACRSIKVKRLFLWLAARQEYQWFKKLDRKKYNLGSGKRVLEKGGKLDKDYLITVPHRLFDNVIM